MAILSSYEGMGNSYLVNSNGTIYLRSHSADSEMELIRGYNVESAISSVASQQQAEEFSAAIASNEDYSFMVASGGKQWIVLSVSSGLEYGAVVVTIPVSETASDTYLVMTVTVAASALAIIVLFALLIAMVLKSYKRDRELSVEIEKSKAKNDFLNKMSHDIRTPLNAIIGAQELMMDSETMDEMKENLRQARISSSYLLSVINDVLDMSRIESGKLSINSIPSYVRNIFNEAVEIEKLPVQEKNLRLTRKTVGNLDISVLCDPVRIKQCLINLLSNAVKFTPAGGQIEFLCSCLESQEHGKADVVFRIKDSGVGMSDSFMKRIFSPFEQERNSMTSQCFGSGLGFSIVHNLTELMGGTVSVSSKLGKGSTFTLSFCFPVCDNPERINDDLSDISSWAAGKHILVVDDNSVNLKILSKLVSHLGFTVDAAENGQSGVEMYLSNPEFYYEMILMDIQMPVMDGLEASRAIRASGRKDCKSILIVALSANAFDEDVKRSIAAGMQAHLSKPIDLNSLKKTIIEWLIEKE
jgi:signal transduction histidine kinase/ActR/RegA family two-component response regulator